ncbi:MAG: cache domain-containing protein, partial [Planctomycetales bacterium]|nr:cache domain-containing protein [Planctomycetales bacterium]
MDADRYARVRELFLAVDDLPDDQHEEFLAKQCGDDVELINEVMSLLQEHDVESARLEGQSAKPPSFPSSNAGQPTPGIRSAESGAGSDSASNLASPFMPGALQSSRSNSDRSASEQKMQKRKTSKSGGRRSGVGSKGKPSLSAEETQQSAQRTHASPRRFDDAPVPSKPPSAGIWQTQAKRHRRFNSGWLWLAAILPTALIGWWTYTRVATSLRNATGNELAGVAESVRMSVSRFLDDQSRLAESWSRSPELRAAIVALVKASAEDDSIESLRQSPHAGEIRTQLIRLSQRPEIKYVVWDRTGRILASWLEDGADVGGSVAPEGAANLSRAMRGETVLFGPAILEADGSGFKPETDLPVMAEIMPIHDDRGVVIATLLVRGLGMYQDLDEIFRQASQAGGLDVYAVNRNGMMVTTSPNAMSQVSGSDGKPTSVSCRLRVSDPGDSGEVANQIAIVTRRTQPLTYAVAGASSGHSDAKLDAYRNYVGTPVVGAWRWLDRWDLGIIVERSAESAYATAGIVGWGFVVLGALLTLTALAAASQIAKRTALAQA